MFRELGTNVSRAWYECFASLIQMFAILLIVCILLTGLPEVISKKNTSGNALPEVVSGKLELGAGRTTKL